MPRMPSIGMMLNTPASHAAVHEKAATFGRGDRVLAAPNFGASASMTLASIHTPSSDMMKPRIAVVSETVERRAIGETERAVAEHLLADQRRDRADRRERQHPAGEDSAVGHRFGVDAVPFDSWAGAGCS